jgi:hypothetical protein
MGDQQLGILVELDPLDHRLLDAQQGSPRLTSRTPFSASPGSGPRQLRT